MRARHLAAPLILTLWAATAAARDAPVPPMVLPGSASAASQTTWIVGADPRAGSVAGLAAAFGAQRIGGLDAFVVRRTGARPFAAALRARRALVFAEPDRRLSRRQATGPGSLAQYNGWRDYIVPGGLKPPADGPLLAVVDSQLAADHPAFRGLPISSTSTAPPTDEHGTAVVGVAAGLEPTLGFTGIYPGAHVLDVASGLRCGELAGRILDAVDRGAAVINMSFGSSEPCFVLYVALMAAVGRGVLPVAAAGNEFLSGNADSFPASFPHVLAVAALNPDGSPTFFSNANFGIDVAAPGIGIVAPVPAPFDTDGDTDGYMGVSGTSFAAPMVAAMATWIRAVRPQLDGEQVAELIRATARDVWKPGYDTDTGYGLPRLGPALRAPAPRRNRYEPNDSIPLVDGTLFGRPDPVLWNGRGRLTVRGALDLYKNPADVFRVSVPAHSRLGFRLGMRAGSARLIAYPGSARSFSARPLARTSTGSFQIGNSSRRARIIYLDVEATSLVGIYDLRLSRLG